MIKIVREQICLMTRLLKVRGRGEFILFRSEVCIRTCPAFQNRGAEREDWCYQNSEERKNVFYILRRGGGGAFEADGEEGKFLSGRIYPLIWSTWTRDRKWGRWRRQWRRWAPMGSTQPWPMFQTMGELRKISSISSKASHFAKVTSV